MTDVLLVFIFFCENLSFKSISISMGRCGIKYVGYFSLSGIFWTSKCLLINIGVFNQRLSHFLSKIHKSLIVLEEIFHLQIRIHLSTRYKKN